MDYLQNAWGVTAICCLSFSLGCAASRSPDGADSPDAGNAPASSSSTASAASSGGDGGGAGAEPISPMNGPEAVNIDGPGDVGSNCENDSDCMIKLICDYVAGSCIDYGDTREVGLDCSLLPVDEHGIADISTINPCGPFICKNGFCRSCVDDGECQGRNVCQQLEGYPFWFCGRPS